ncbi:MAG: AmmeMemoRadiSam system protein A [Acidobacteria bacterium]|nr:MAG: AmmeMemoRadiSam system protein A [Acidobacteriota bacterium]
MTADAETRARLVGIAREAIRRALRSEPFHPQPLPPPYDRPRALFVTLRRRDGALRGCIGHLRPVRATLAEEVADCARAAALSDVRFPPVEEHELDELAIEISLLGTPEPVGSAAELDPRRYGVIVSRGSRRGVLLPDIEGVDTPEQQLAIAARKAGLAPDEPYAIERFTVEKIVEDGT